MKEPMSERKANMIIALIAVAFAALLVAAVPIGVVRSARYREAVACCRSLGGEYANGKCFINGEEE